MDDTFIARKEKESLCFLILGFRKQDQDYRINGWQICYSCENEVIRKIVYWSSDERCCLRDLVHELQWCSVHKTSVVTYRKIDMPSLRMRLLVHGITALDFSRVHSLCVEEIVQQHFFIPERIEHSSLQSLAEAMNIKTTKVISAELLREVFVRIQPLLPTEVV